MVIYLGSRVKKFKVYVYNRYKTFGGYEQNTTVLALQIT